MIEAHYIFAAVAVIGTSIGAYVDYKKTWIPDSVNYFMIAFGLIGNIVVSIITSSFTPILYSLFGFLSFLAIGLTLYYLGGTGGGDAKMFMGFGALLATFPAVSLWPFLMTILANTILISGLFGAIVLLARLTTKKPLFTKEISPSNLMEGDWIKDNISVGELHYTPKRTGIDKETIEKLKQLERDGKLKSITIKTGIPMAPAIFVALLISLFAGDLMFMVVSSLL